MRTPLGGARRIAFYISGELDAAMAALRDREGASDAETIRRALAAYLTEKGVLTARGGQGRARTATRHTKGRSQ